MGVETCSLILREEHIVKLLDHMANIWIQEARE
jgi:hypothetical protein